MKKIIGILSFVFFIYFIYKKAEKLMAFASKLLNDERVSAKLNQMFNESVVGEMVNQIPEQIENIPAEVEKAVQKVTDTIEKSAPKMAVNTEAFNLNDRQREIYDLIKKEVELNMSAILGKVKNVTDRTLRRDMTKLERLGLINHSGKTRDSVYRLRD
jgi:predicted GTPase